MPDPGNGRGVFVRDGNPAVSPDGRWLVFASTRGREHADTSLWLAPLGPEAEPVRLTVGPAIDAHPAWTPDGNAIVFASTRDGGDFDLWRIAIDPRSRRPIGAPTQLTRADTHEVMPSIARDGTIAYAVVHALGARDTASHVEILAPDGSIRSVTQGPADTTPALSADGRTLAFARPRSATAGADVELWVTSWRGSTWSEPTQVIDLPLTDETGPVWSRDGRFLFATSIYVGDDRRPLFSSIVHVDLREPERRARMLDDRVGPIVRLTPAIVAPVLDAAALHGDPEYLSELAKIMAAAVTKAKAQSQ